jgi:hypothetical protein
MFDAERDVPEDGLNVTSGTKGGAMDTRLRRLAAGLVVASGLVMVGTAGAQSAERLGCPAGYDLMTVEQINATLTTSGFEQAVVDFDALGNDDGYLCVHLLPGAAAKKTPFDPLMILRDNTVGNPNSEVVIDPRTRP